MSFDRDAVHLLANPANSGVSILVKLFSVNYWSFVDFAIKDIDYKELLLE